MKTTIKILSFALAISAVTISCRENKAEETMDEIEETMDDAQETIEETTEDAVGEVTKPTHSSNQSSNNNSSSNTESTPEEAKNEDGVQTITVKNPNEINGINVIKKTHDSVKSNVEKIKTNNPNLNGGLRVK